MLGPEGAAAAVATLLEQHTPATVDLLIERLDLAGLRRVDRELLYPAQYLAHDIATDLPVGDWPAILVVAQNLAGLTPIDPAVTATGRHTGHPLYAATYKVRAYLFVRGRDDELTDLARKRIALAVRETLLSHLAFTVTIGDESATGEVDPLSVRESYTDLAAEQALGTIAGAITDLDVTLAEAVTLVDATAAPEAVAVDVVGPHPALD